MTGRAYAFPENRAMLGGELHTTLTAAVRAAATLTVAAHSTDAADCAELLAMLGLTPATAETP